MFNSLLPVNGSILGGCGILKNLVWPGLKVGLIEANFKTKPNFEARQSIFLSQLLSQN